MTKNELRAAMADLAIEADTSGFPHCAIGLQLLLRAGTFPERVQRYLANAAHLLLDTVALAAESKSGGQDGQ